MESEPKQPLTFIDRMLNMSEARVRYLTKPTLIDRAFAATILKLFPETVTPNQVTLFRFVMIPVIVLALVFGYTGTGLVLFVLAALSDAVDGAMARTRKHITSWGILADPVADKLLVGLVSLILVTQYLSVPLGLTIVLLEFLLIASAYFRYKGRVVPAKTMGKLKMILQCVGIGLLLLAVVTGFAPLYVAAQWTLYGAVLFALLSLTVFRSI
jgi:CDP-diacylglycerol--glycerol-3-phosphate 3-phosphatidyltransferase